MVRRMTKTASAQLIFICNLAQILEDRNMSQRKLQQLTGLSNRTITTLCNNKRNERIDRKVSQILIITLGVTFDELWTSKMIDENS